MNLDPRLTPARPDLAAEHLRGTVQAARFVAPTALVVTLPVAPLTAAPEPEAPCVSQLLYGEVFWACESTGDWAWGQSALDGYVGYLPRLALEPQAAAPTHRVRQPLAHVYPAPDLKTRPIGMLPLGARVAAGGSGAWAALATGGHVYAAHLAALDAAEADWVAVAEQLLGAPYLWGGRSAMGIDCSGLVQLALQAAGRDCPRDSDMQAAGLGRSLKPGAQPRRGDLIFWRGHVGVMLDRVRLLHANAHAMAVSIERLDAAVARIAASGGGPVTRHARLGEARP